MPVLKHMEAAVCGLQVVSGASSWGLGCPAACGACSALLIATTSCSWPCFGPPGLHGPRLAPSSTHLALFGDCPSVVLALASHLNNQQSGRSSPADRIRRQQLRLARFRPQNRTPTIDLSN